MATRKKARPEIQLYRFKWQGADESGRRLSGEVVSRSQAAVQDELQKHRITVKRVRKKGSLSGRGRVNARDITVFTRQMATMIRAGIPMLQSLEVVSESVKKPSMVRLLQDLANDVSAGSSFSEALRRHPR
ncbi:MAG: type II secretion system F family protein, partial [Halomonas sp.]